MAITSLMIRISEGSIVSFQNFVIALQRCISIKWNSQSKRKRENFMAKRVRYFRELVAHLENELGKESAQMIIAKALKRYDILI